MENLIKELFIYLINLFIGAHNLPVEEAANIQDTFADFIVERLNFRK